MAPPPSYTADNASSGNEANLDVELVQVLAEKGIKEVPPSFVQHIEEPVAEGGDGIPVIDMSEILGTNKESALRKLASACEDWGFFQVINHGIAEEVLNNMKEVSRKFFQMPVKEKQRYSRGQSVSDFEGYGRYNTASEAISDWVDVLAFFVEPPRMRNLNKWPTQPSAFREVTEEYSSQIQKFTLSLVAAICETLGLPSDYIEEMSGDYSSALRVNYYPPCPQPDKALGVSSHSDGGTITVLIEDAAESSSSSLQVRKDGNWVAVKGIPDALIVNAGDMLQVISNGKYKSVDHRAVVNTRSDRLSMVMFYYPSLDPHIQVSPAKQLVTEASPALYRSISYCDYLTHYMTDKAPGKARVDFLLS